MTRQQKRKQQRELVKENKSMINYIPEIIELSVLKNYTNYQLRTKIIQPKCLD